MFYAGSVTDMLAGFNAVSVAVRIFLAILFAGVIGFEREQKKRAAGFRTYILVAVGSALAMLTDQYIAIELGGASPVRIAAQVVSGVGFLGAGTIMVTGRNQVKGLTTAAGLWACACVGLALGAGFYLGAFMGFVAVFIAMAMLSRVDKSVGKRRSYQAELLIEGENLMVISKLTAMAKERGSAIHFERIEHLPGGHVALLARFGLGDENELPGCIERTLLVEHVVSCEEVL